MESGIGYIVCKATCDICNTKWTGVVEVDYIQLDEEYKEYKLPENLQCHNCLQYIQLHLKWFKCKDRKL